MTASIQNATRAIGGVPNYCPRSLSLIRSMSALPPVAAIGSLRSGEATQINRIRPVVAGRLFIRKCLRHHEAMHITTSVPGSGAMGHKKSSSTFSGPGDGGGAGGGGEGEGPPLEAAPPESPGILGQPGYFSADW